MGTVYLLHLDPPYRHARHYLGYVSGKSRKAVEARLAQHLAGQGARLLAVAVAAGCTAVVARTWADKDRAFERALKNRRCAPDYCPLCRSVRRVARIAEGVAT